MLMRVSWGLRWWEIRLGVECFEDGDCEVDGVLVWKRKEENLGRWHGVVLIIHPLEDFVMIAVSSSLCLSEFFAHKRRHISSIETSRLWKPAPSEIRVISIY